MRLVTYEHGSRRAIGAVNDGSVIDLQSAYARYLADVEDDPRAAEIAAVRIPPDMAGFVAGLEPSWRAAEQALAYAAGTAAGEFVRALEDVRLVAPLVPPAILNSGQNYWDHRDEKPAVEQHDPEFFLKAPLAVIGPDEPIVYDPVVTKKLDYEVELAVVITSLATRWRTTSLPETGRSFLIPRAAGSTGSAPERTSIRRRRSDPGSSLGTRSPIRRASSFGRL